MESAVSFAPLDLSISPGGVGQGLLFADGPACFSAGRGEHPWSSMQQMEEEKTWRFLGASLSRLEQTTSMAECNFVSDSW